MFERYFGRYTYTVDLLDEFEASEEDTMLLKNAFSLVHGWKEQENQPGKVIIVEVDLHIVNPRKNTDYEKHNPYYYTNFTMTELKELHNASTIYLGALDMLEHLPYTNIPKISLASYIFLNRNKELFDYAIRELYHSKAPLQEAVLFDKAIRINAQNSNNRDGSSSYLGYNPHGKTSDYYITGFSLSCDKW